MLKELAPLPILGILAAWCLSRTRREYREAAQLSVSTAVGVWFLYGLHGAVTLVAAIETRGELPLGMGCALPVGLGLASLGIVLFAGGVVAFRSLRRMSGRDATELITSGMHRWSRNPQMVGWGLLLTGISLAGRSGLALLWTALYWLSFRAYLPIEEAFLRQRYGEAYVHYCAMTPRYLGWPRSRRGRCAEEAGPRSRSR